MQDWSSKVWIKTNGEVMLVTDLSLIETLQALWAMYVLSSKHSCFVHLPYTTLGRSIYSHLRTLQTGLENDELSKELSRIKDARVPFNRENL
jgi:hypothetical protein